jgi:hypothetical protein
MTLPVSGEASSTHHRDHTYCESRGSTRVQYTCVHNCGMVLTNKHHMAEHMGHAGNRRGLLPACVLATQCAANKKSRWATQRAANKKSRLATQRAAKKKSTCTLCRKALARPYQLAIHMGLAGSRLNCGPVCVARTERAAIKPKCTLCGKVFTSPYLLDVHIGLIAPRLRRGPACVEAAERAAIQRQPKCTLCEKVFTRPFHLAEHMGFRGSRLNCGPACVAKAERAAIQPKCTLCGKVFTRPSRLKQHMGLTLKGSRQERGPVCMVAADKQPHHIPTSSSPAASPSTSTKSPAANSL